MSHDLCMLHTHARRKGTGIFLAGGTIYTHSPPISHTHTHTHTQIHTHTHAHAHREGINIFLAGFVPTENLRFREVRHSC